MLTLWLICIVTVITQNVANAEDVSGKFKFFHQIYQKLALKLQNSISKLDFLKLLELETVHTPGSELASAIKVVNKVNLIFS